MAHDVFISYAEEDKLAANSACTTLESEGISCWIAPRDIRPGAKWGQAIMDAISASRVMMLVFSEHANRSDHVQREVGSAFDNGITVIPFRLTNTKPTGDLDYYLRPVQWLDAFTQPLESHLKSLAIQIRDLLSESDLLSEGEAVAAESSVMKVFRGEEDKLIISFQGPKFQVGGQLTARLDLGHTKGLIGPSTNPSEQRGFHNEENTLFGINHQPCTKASCVYFFVFTNENFIVIKDVNARVARFLDEPWELGFLRIQSISGKTARLQTIDFRERPPYPQKEILVNVDGDGRITLIPEKNAPRKES
jgi:hypothetical protein